MRLLLVEDDVGIAEPLQAALRREGFEVRWARTGGEVMADIEVAAVLLDLGLPDMDGRALCRQIRAVSSVPIIIVTASGAEFDKVSLLEFGADDYVEKPFGVRELIARIRAVTRRSALPVQEPTTLAEIGGCVIDRRSRLVTVDGEAITLTKKEFDLLALLASDPGAVMSREQIISDVWDENWWGSTKTLDVHIASLRKKLPSVTIETVRGVGYRLAELG